MNDFQAQSRNRTYVVGNIFSAFAARHHNVITFAEFDAQTRKSSASRSVVYVTGQGLRPEQHVSVLAANEISTLPPRKANRHETHKHREENRLISSPRKLTSTKYELDLLVDERNELLQDHLTGQHIQGMVLFEAARQSFLAVTENFFVAGRMRQPTFILNEGGVEFRSFVFPISARIDYVVEESDLSRPHRLKFAVRETVVQQGVPAAIVRFNFSVYEKDRILERENEKAQLVVAHDAEVAK